MKKIQISEGKRPIGSTKDVPEGYHSSGNHYDGIDTRVGNTIDSGIGLSITIDNLRVFINQTLSILSAYQ